MSDNASKDSKPIKFLGVMPAKSEPPTLGRLDVPWAEGTVETPVGLVPRIKTALLFSDRMGSWKARWGVGRMRYLVKPGLYAVGSPTEESPVFVSANYKMSFDRLRESLGGMDCWVLVLNTDGINVWCAAGKGTMGTDELIGRVESAGLSRIVTHRRLIAPQLAAPGISAHEVRRKSGFRVIYGPVRSEDIKAFMESGLKATDEMRQVTFPLKERVALIPMELVLGAKWAVFVAIALFVLSGLGPGVYSVTRTLQAGPLQAAILLLAFLAATAFGSALLPWLPGKPFSVKGALLGASLALTFFLATGTDAEPFANIIGIAAWTFIITAVSSFMVMNFTGSSTYTSLSGVREEMRIAVPIQIIAAVVGVGLWIGDRFV